MNALVIYDSKFGNTRQIAQTVGDALGAGFAVRMLSVAEVGALPADMDLLLVGGPTQGHGVSAPMKAFLGAIGRGALRGVPAAAFDTRFQIPRWLSGSAAGVIARRLRQAGCALVVPAESFFVARGQEGPLLPGELERAPTWARAVLAAVPAAVRLPVAP